MAAVAAPVAAPVAFQFASRLGPPTLKEGTAHLQQSLASQQASLFGIPVCQQRGHLAGHAERLLVAVKAEQEYVSDSPAKRSDMKKAPSQKHRHQPLVSMSKRQLLLGAAGMVMGACPLCKVGHAGAADWSYGALSGPLEWNSVCSAGTKQSPIDLPVSLAGLLDKDPVGALEFAYKRAGPSFLNTGHGTMQVDFPTDSNYLQIGDRKLTLLQYHFHAPSEHSFNGARAAMEAHLVHRDEQGRLAVVGVMMEAQPSAPRNLCLQAALDFAPPERGASSATPVECLGDSPDNSPEDVKESKEPQLCYSLQISPSSLLPKPTSEGRRPYIHYAGSLTTPPCSEGVEWFMLTSPVKVPGDQVLDFMTYVGDGMTLAMNSRPLQDIGERTIYFGL